MKKIKLSVCNIWFFLKKSEFITDLFIMTDIYVDFVNRWKKMSLHICDNLRELLSDRLTTKIHIYEKKLDSEYESDLNINVYRIKSVSGRFSVCHSYKFKALHLKIQDQTITNNVIDDDNESSSLRITLNKFTVSKLSSFRSCDLTSKQESKNENRDKNAVFEWDEHNKNDEENNSFTNRLTAENSVNDDYEEHDENEQSLTSSLIENHLRNADEMSKYKACSLMFDLNTNLCCLLSCLMK